MGRSAVCPVTRTLWLCPCLRPHLVALEGVRPEGRFHGYCDWSRQAIDLVFLCEEDSEPRQYLLKRSHQRE